jgi:uncharacterized protein (DUF1330 family)
MAAYIIADVEITDPERYAEYIRVVPATIARYGGRFLVRGGDHETLEGTWKPKRVVILEFPSYERAREWWSSEHYRGPRELRQSASTGSLVLVQGV